MLKIYTPSTPTTDPRDKAACSDDKGSVRKRQLITVIFAIAVVLIAGQAQAQEQAQDREARFQYGWTATESVEHLPAPRPALAPVRVEGGRIPPRVNTDSRPVYLEMNASMANFDADPDPDGWRVELVLRDRHDRPTQRRSQAVLELRARSSTVNPGQYVNADFAPIRWSMPLKFDQDAVARLRLPLRQPFQPIQIRAAAGSRGATGSLRASANRRRRWSTGNINSSGLHRSIARWEADQDVGLADFGELRARVSVPTEGVFEAVTAVRIRPPVLVDTQWPYR